MADESREQKAIIVAFDLAKDYEDRLHDAYVALAELGFSRTEQNILLPTKVVMGSWFADDGPEQIRDLIAWFMKTKGVTLATVLVIEYTLAAFAGPRLP